ncbi:MAG: methyl-accepting chemotaxis protein [Desulfobulbaceae bacterium]|nr:methyl-accepting chemotaxis protein [Desulfobulbaceae bacterium]
MQWFYDLTLKAKLLSGFITVALLAVVIGFIGTTNIHKINQADTFLYEKMALPLGYLIDMSTEFQHIRVNVLKYANAASPEARNKIYADIEKNKADLATADEKYTHTFINDDDKKLFSEYQGKQQAYTKLVALMHSLGKEGKIEELKALIGGEMHTASGEYQSIVNKLHDLNMEAAKAQAEANDATAAAASLEMDILMVVGGLLAVGLGLFIASIVQGQLGADPAEVKNIAGKVALGDVAMTIDLTGKKPDCLLAAMDKMVKSIKTKTEAAQVIAAGDLTGKIEVSSPQDTLGQALQTMQQGLSVTITQTKLAGNEIANGALQIADSSQSLAQGASEQASSLEEISSAMTQMSSQTKMTADNAHKAQELSHAASAAAEEGNRQMQQMVEAMEEIQVASQSVANVIKVIEEIAFQTNMLALNAAVEAAHAGQHGKGFAVVAEEVRNLAARSAKAAKETADLIAGSVSKTENGAKIADLTAASLAEITNRVAQTSDLVKGIAEAAREQSQGIDQVSQGLHQIDQVTQQNSANAEEGAAASEQLSGQASHLNQLMQAFKVDSGNTAINPSHHSHSTTPTAGLKQPVKQLGMAPKSKPEPSKVIPLDDGDFAGLVTA